MAEKSKLYDGIMLRRGLSKFDATLLSNDGGQYSPSIRRIRQNYMHDNKCCTSKILLSPTQSSSIARQLSKRIRDPKLSSLQHHQSSTDLLVTSLKCDHCQKNEGLFQCCHCNQHLCIQCCNKHYKKVTEECEHLHELSNSLLAKIIRKKSDLEKQKKETIEQCHKWRIDTINTINAAHKIVIQAIYDEYDILNKEYELFIKKEMSYININEHELIAIQKRKPSSLLLPSSSSSPITAKDSIKSIDTIKSHIETLTKYIDDNGIFSLKVKLPKFDVNNDLGIESHFGDNIRVINAPWPNDDYSDNISLTTSDDISKEESLLDSQPIESKPDDSLSAHHKERMDCSSISAKPLSTIENIHPDTHLFRQSSSCSMQSIDDTFDSKNIPIKSDHDLQQMTTAISSESSSSSSVDSPSNDYAWYYHRTNLNLSSI